MFERNLQYINGQGGAPLEFDAGFAVNPSANGNIPGNAFAAKDFRNILITLVGTGTVKFHGSIQNLPPDFTAGSSIFNSHAPIMAADYSLPNTYWAGATGVIVSNETKIVELNTNVLAWFGIERSDDTVDVIVTVTDNL